MGPEVSLTSFPSGVADPETRHGYTTDTTSAVHALELDKGTLSWQTQTVARPVALTKDSVIALSTNPEKQNQLQIIGLNKKDGSAQSGIATLEFPNWVKATLTPDDSFDYEISTDHDELIIEWKAQARYRGGAAPSNHLIAQLPNAAALARINLRSGVVSTADKTDESPVELPKDVQDAIAFPYQRGASLVWHTEPWKVDRHFTIIVGEVSGDEQSLSLVKWQSGSDKSSSMQLVSGEALVSYVTSDGLFVFIHSESGKEKNDPWWIFSVKAGSKLAILNYEPGTKEECVLGTRVYYLVEQPPPSPRTGGEILTLTVKAVDFSSGAVAWQRPLSERQTRRAPMLRQ